MAYGRRIDKSGHDGIEIHKVSLFPADFADNAAVDTGYDLPGSGLVVECYANVVTAEATATTKTIDVGLLAGESGGDADGFLDGISVATAGIVKGTLASGGQTRGALLRVDESGAGVVVPEAHRLNGTAKSVVVTFGDAAGATEMVVDLYFHIIRPF